MHLVALVPRQAWLPQEQIRPLVGPSEQEILEALGVSAVRDFKRAGPTEDRTRYHQHESPVINLSILNYINIC